MELPLGLLGFTGFIGFMGFPGFQGITDFGFGPMAYEPRGSGLDSPEP